jgi:flagellar biosynthesis anti-sigma factor FlgM
MDLRSSLDGLKTILGVTPETGAPEQRQKAGPAPDAGSLPGDRATLSSAASEVAQSAADGGVRAAKVAEIQAALEAGTYNVPASAVAARMVDAMLEHGK